MDLVVTDIFLHYRIVLKKKNLNLQPNYLSNIRVLKMILKVN